MYMMKKESAGKTAMPATKPATDYKSSSTNGTKKMFGLNFKTTSGTKPMPMPKSS